MVIDKMLPRAFKIEGRTLEKGSISMYVEFGSFQGKAVDLDSRHQMQDYFKLSDLEKLTHQKIIKAEKPIINFGTRSTEDLVLSNSDIYPDRVEYTEDELNALAGKDLSLSAFLNDSIAGQLLREIQSNLGIRYNMQEVSITKNGYSEFDLTWDTTLDTKEFYTVIGYNIRNGKYWSTLIKRENKTAVEEDIIEWQLPNTSPYVILKDYQYVSAWELTMWAWNLYLLNQIRGEKSILEYPFY